MIWMFGAMALAEDLPVRPVGVLRELDHPSYVDEAGTVLPWVDVKALAAPTDALGQVRARRAGRTALKVGFAAATALEAGFGRVVESAVHDLDGLVETVIDAVGGGGAAAAGAAGAAGAASDPVER